MTISGNEMRWKSITNKKSWINIENNTEESYICRHAALARDRNAWQTNERLSNQFTAKSTMDILIPWLDHVDAMEVVLDSSLLDQRQKMRGTDPPRRRWTVFRCELQIIQIILVKWWWNQWIQSTIRLLLVMNLKGLDHWGDLIESAASVVVWVWFGERVCTERYSRLKQSV